MKVRRLEAFGGGVLAIVITIVVLELKVPRGTGLAALRELLYAMSIGYLGTHRNGAPLWGHCVG